MQSVLENSYSKPRIVTEPIKFTGSPKLFKWTVGEYYQMADLGFFRGKRVELIKGEILETAPMKSPHAKLLVEVSDSSLRYDRKTKVELYAENRIEEYWILNLKQRCLEVYRRPVKDKSMDFAYTRDICC